MLYAGRHTIALHWSQNRFIAILVHTLLLVVFMGYSIFPFRKNPHPNSPSKVGDFAAGIFPKGGKREILGQITFKRGESPYTRIYRLTREQWVRKNEEGIQCTYRVNPLSSVQTIKTPAHVQTPPQCLRKPTSGIGELPMGNEILDVSCCISSALATTMREIET